MPGVHVAGRPSQVGGKVAHAFGWVVLVGGVLMALLIGSILQALFPAGFAGWAVGLVVAALALMVGIPMISAGRTLERRGRDVERLTREQAIFAIAAHENGTLTASTVARALGIGMPEADELLTDLAREPGGRVLLEIDDEGDLTYVFPDLRPVRIASPITNGVPSDREPVEAEIEEEELGPRPRSPRPRAPR